MVYNTDMTYTVGKLASLAGVSVRTLRHYHSVGLLKPDSILTNGYRVYAKKSLLRLQQVLLYRELGLGLSQIREILDTPGFDALESLLGHRQSLLDRISRLQTIVATVDETIDHMRGTVLMKDKDLFGGLNEKQQEEYAIEAQKRWDAKTVQESNARWKAMPTDKKQLVIDQGNKVYADFAKAIDFDPTSPEVQAVVLRWRNHIEHFWKPDLDGLLGLADLYNDDPRFFENISKVNPKLPEFIREAVRHYVNSRR